MKSVDYDDTTYAFISYMQSGQTHMAFNEKYYDYTVVGLTFRHRASST